MANRYRIPITTITVFGVSSLIALSTALVLYLGLNLAVESTRLLWAQQSSSLIDGLENSLDARLRPVREQARWVAADIREIGELEDLDTYFFGTLAASPQVTGLAVITPSGQSRRWLRGAREAISEDWSEKPWLSDYVKLLEASRAPQWREPIFEESIADSSLLHDVPLRDREGNFIGIFAQIISIRELSSYLARTNSDTGVTPFVLYDRNFVLAHPLVLAGDLDAPLQSLDSFGDTILQRIWTPDESADFVSAALDSIEASGIFRGDDYFLYLHRDITHFGPAPWTIGVYLDTSLIADQQIGTLQRGLIVGVVVLILAIGLAVLIGRKVSTPVREIANAAERVKGEDLDAIGTLGSSRIRELDDACDAFNNMVTGLRERQLIRETLGRFVPEKVAASLLHGGGDIPVQQTEATILFCDIEGFTSMTESLGPVRIVDVLNDYFSAMVDILERHGGVVTQFQGDAILATFNVPVTDPEHAGKALAAACEMLEAVASRRFEGEIVNIRIGINTGDVVAGAIGARGRLNYTVHGDAVNRAARLEALNKEYGSRLLLSETTAARLQEKGLVRVDDVTVRGQSESIELYSLEAYRGHDSAGDGND